MKEHDKEQINPFRKGHPTYLVYRSKRLLSSSQDQPQDETNRWRTFGFYDSLIVEKKPEANYKDCFAIRFPRAFNDRPLLAKQVFTLLPFPDRARSPKGEPPKSELLDKSSKSEDELSLPFLGIIMAEMNMLQDQSGEPCAEQKREGAGPETAVADHAGGPDPEQEKEDPLAYLKKLETYRGRAQAVLERNKAEADPPEKNELSHRCKYDFLLSTNCADLCIVMRTVRIEDIYLATKLIRIHFSLSNQQEQPSPKLHYQPRISTIAAMSTHAEDYDNDLAGFRVLNDGMAVDFRLSCHSTSAEMALLRCCAKLEPDTPRKEPKQGIYPGERIGGVLGVGQYSIYMSLLDYLDLFFNHKDFRRKPDKERTLLARTLKQVDNNNDYDISNIRLRFCNNAELADLNPEEQDRVKHLIFPQKNPDLKKFEEFLVVLRRALSLHRNQVHYSAYMLKEALSMINDLYYTYNDLLYEENIHSYILATQLFALSSNALKYLNRIAAEVKKQCEKPEMPPPSSQQPVIDAVDQLIETIHEVVRSINAYNKSVVSHSQNNLNYPNYEIQSKVNIEKYQVAYTAFVQRLCDLFPVDGQYCQNPTLTYVYLNLNEDDTNAKQHFAVHPFQVMNGELNNQHVGSVRMLPIASPNYRRFAHMHHLLPQLCHELGHHLRFLTRPERNRNVYSYMLEPVASRVAEQVIEYAPSGFSDSFVETRTMLCSVIQRVLIDEMYDCLFGSYQLGMLPFSVLELPIGSFLYEQLNYEQSSFSRFWNGYRDLLGLAAEVSGGKIRIYGADASSIKALPNDDEYLYPVNLTISALNSFLVTKCNFSTGYKQQGDAFASDWNTLKESLKKESESSWGKTVSLLMEARSSTTMDVNVLLSVALSLVSGICSALMDSFFLSDEELQRLPCDYKDEWKGFIAYYLWLHYALSFYISDDASTLKEDVKQNYGPPSVRNQRILIQRAATFCNQMKNYSGELNRIARTSTALANHASQVDAACAKVQRAINILHYLIRERDEVDTAQGTYTDVEAIPIVVDRTVGRIERIISDLRRLAPKASDSDTRLDSGLVSLLQNEEDFRRWLSAAFRMLSPKACMQEALSYYDSYNEVTADLAMCAAMNFTPFGYLAYAEHLFAEQPEQTAYLPFTVERVRNVVTVLLFDEALSGKEQSLKDSYDSRWKSLKKDANAYLKKVNDALKELIKNINDKIPDKAELVKKLAEDVKCDNLDVQLCEAWVETCIWDVDELTLELREYYNKLSNSQNYKNASTPEKRKALQEERNNLQDNLESTTDLLAHLRTLKRICYMLNKIPEAPPQLPSGDRSFSLIDHYRMLWFAMNTKAENKDDFKQEVKNEFGKNAVSAFEKEVRNQWIKASQDNETLQAISRHYNCYYERPCQPRNDEHLDQVHFVLRHYWEGNRRYRSLLDTFDWKLADEKTDWDSVIGNWFKRWDSPDRPYLEGGQG